MAYISKEERRDLTKAVHKTYGWRKFLIFLNIVMLIAFIILTFISFYKANKDPESWWNFFKQSESGDDWSVKGLSTWGIIMLVVAIVMVIMSVTIVVLTFQMRSPRAITEKVLKLESAPLGGKRVGKKVPRGIINKERVEGKRKPRQPY